jgi:DNA-binding CsgD family transcriptional regulator
VPRIYRILSRKDAINSDLTKVCSDKAYIATVLANDELVMQTKKHHIYDEQLILINDCSLNTISVKLPWLDQDNKPIGIIGCSVKVQLDSLDSLAKNLTKITELFLSPTGITNSLLPPNSTINGIYYSPREIEVMEWVIHGKTMRDIGEILGISRRTAESYFINIKNKAGVDTKSDLIDFLLAHQ